MCLLKHKRHSVIFFKALFPSASITGAPKIQTMKLIQELETDARDIYTGSIGYFAPNRQCQFNVAIRTLTIDSKKGNSHTVLVAALYGILRQIRNSLNAKRKQKLSVSRLSLLTYSKLCVGAPQTDLLYLITT